MGFNESLTTNGDYTVTNLKGATGISDDRLSAHHPNGAGNTTKMEDFSIRALGHDLSAGDLTRLLRPVAVNGNSISGSYDSQDPPWYVFDNVVLDPAASDTFTVRVHLPSGQKGQYAIEQILRDGTGLSEDVNGNVSLINKTVNANSIDLQYEVTGYVNVQVGVTFADGMNVNAENVGKASSDKEGNSLPEDCGLIFRSEDVLDALPRITNVHVRVRDDGTDVHFDLNVDSNDQNIGEGFVVYDPQGQIDGQFYMYDDDPSTVSSYANDTEPDFLSDNHPEQVVSEFAGSEGSRVMTFYIELQDQASSTEDVVQVEISEADTGTWQSTRQCYAYITSEDRTRGTISNPYAMNYNGSC